MVNWNKNIGIYFLFFILLLQACSTDSKEDRVVAKVFNKNLYFSDIRHIFPKGSSKEDSLSMARLYIDKWISTQLLLRKAEINLSKEQLDISKEIETYRTSLLIYKYEDQMLYEKLDTTISGDEIQDYYDNNTANFILNEFVVKALYIQLPADAPNVYNVKRWYISDKEKDIQSLTEYCSTYALRCDFFNDDWIFWSDIEKELPQPEAASKQIVNGNRIEQQNDKFIFLVNIKEKKGPGDIVPLAFVREKVKNIIINKRKLDFISNLEKKIYSDALKKKQFEIYPIN
ncbi:MAG: hypothetical protein LBQ60_12590 [Bacteroidales bacterium]|jgi:hypothetical protein|nr:hypothetical protein [Bacteroidales bacterium]